MATFLGNLKWTALSNLSKRFKGRKKVEWFFKGSPPSNSHQTGWTYQVNDEEPWSFHILLAPPRTPNSITYHTDGPRRSAFSDQPDVSSAKGVSRKGRPRTKESEERPRSRSPHGGRNVADSDNKKENDDHQPTEVDASPAPTQLDSQPSDTKDEASTTKPISCPLDPIDAVRQGWKRVDQGGSGDCDRERYIPFFGLGRKGPKNFDQFVSEAAAPETWVHGATLQACAEKFGCPIIVWRKPANGAWQRFCFASRFSAGFACAATEECPLVICLEKQHYTTLRPPSREAVPKNWLRETAGIQTEQFGGAGRKKTTSENCIGSPQHHGAGGLSDAGSSIATPSVHTCRAPSGFQGRNNDAKVSQGTPSVHSLAHSELTPSVHTIGPASSERPLVVSPSAHSGARAPSVHTLGQNSEVNIHGCSRHSVDFSGSTPTSSEPCLSNQTLLDCLPTPKRFRLTYKQQVFHESGAYLLDPNKVVPTHDAGRSSTIRDSRPSRHNRKCTFDWTCPICKETMTLTGHDKAARQRQRHLRTVHNSDLSQVGGSHGDRIWAGFKSRTTPCSNGAIHQLRAIQRMNTEKQRSDHDIRHANKDGLFPVFRKTWWCSRCLARGTTRDILGRPCNPELWSTTKARWWLGLQPLFKQKISSFASWPSDGIQKVDAMAMNLINMYPPRLPKAPHVIEKAKQKMKEQRKHAPMATSNQILARIGFPGKRNSPP